MARRAALLFSALALAACTTASPPPGAVTEPRTVPAPPPMPEADVPEGGAPADLRTASASACTIAIFSEVPRQIEGVERVQANDASLTTFPAEGERVRVVGSGRYYVEGADWRPFDFECVYDRAAARIAAFSVNRA